MLICTYPRFLNIFLFKTNSGQNMFWGWYNVNWMRVFRNIKRIMTKKHLNILHLSSLNCPLPANRAGLKDQLILKWNFNHYQYFMPVKCHCPNISRTSQQYQHSLETTEVDGYMFNYLKKTTTKKIMNKMNNLHTLRLV